MTATRPEDQPDPHPDSPPFEPAGDPERIDLGPERRKSPMEDPGSPGGTGGTGGTNHEQDD